MTLPMEFSPERPSGLTAIILPRGLAGSLDPPLAFVVRASCCFRRGRPQVQRAAVVCITDGARSYTSVPRDGARDAPSEARAAGGAESGLRGQMCVRRDHSRGRRGSPRRTPRGAREGGNPTSTAKCRTNSSSASRRRAVESFSSRRTNTLRLTATRDASPAPVL